MRFPIIFRRNTIILITLLLGIIRADVIVVGSWDPKPDYTGTYRQVDGYINQTTNVKITVTLTGDDASGGSADKSEGIVQVFAGFLSSANVSLFPVDLEGHGLDGRETSSAFSGNPDVNIVEYDITHTIILSANSSAQGKYVDMIIKFEDASPDVSYAVNWSSSSSLLFETDVPKPYVKVMRASDTWTHYDFSGENFSTQQVYINPDEVLSNHSGTYKNYIKFTDNNGTNYRYEIGGVDASELNGNADTLDMTSNVEKYTAGAWTDNVGDAFVDGRVYDFYSTIYDLAGNIRERSQDCGDCNNNRTFDGTAPTVVINGAGAGGVTFGPGNNPITSNPTDDSSAPYYHAVDENVIIYFNWPETM